VRPVFSLRFPRFFAERGWGAAPLGKPAVPAHSRGVSENRDVGGATPDPAAAPEPDLEYDLAHEPGIAEVGKTTLPGQRPMSYVATETTEYDGDYGYDLAHDVPRR
jgi:hypothetical protein